MKSNAWFAFTVVLALLGGTLFTVHFAPTRTTEKLVAPLDTIDEQIEGWTLLSADSFGDQPFPATSYIARTYAKDSKDLGLLVAYHNNRRDAVNIHNPENCLPGSGWEIWKTEPVQILFDGQPVTINQYHVSKGDQRKVVLYWYQTRKRVVADELFAKVMLMRDAVVEGRTSGAFIRIAIPDDPKVVQEGLRFSEVVVHQVGRCFRT